MTSYTILFLPEARLELLKAWEWYEDRQIGLGDRFKVLVYERIKKIAQNPELFAEKKRYYREANVAVFPYLIIYRLRKRSKEILITSVFHTSRNSRKKYRTG